MRAHDRVERDLERQRDAAAHDLQVGSHLGGGLHLLGEILLEVGDGQAGRGAQVGLLEAHVGRRALVHLQRGVGVSVVVWVSVKG